MRRKKVEMILSGLDDLERPDPSLEQYRTPHDIVVDILFWALNEGDIPERRVAELGSGSAPFLIGSLLLGASWVYGCDVDPRAVELSKGNIEKASCIKDIVIESGSWHVEEADVGDRDHIFPDVHTVFMNPPFGAQRKGADRPFLERAAVMGKVVYSIHNAGTSDFIRVLAASLNCEITHERKYTMSIPHRFSFHTREKIGVNVVCFRMAVM